VCKLQLPERISSGTHATWVAGSAMRRWHQTDSAAEAIGLAGAGR
jgi:carotenoid cleavage dioxygenase